MRRVQHEIVLTRLDGLGFQFHYRFFAGLLRFLFPVVLLDVFVAHALWSTESTARLKVAVGSVYRGDAEVWVCANDVLLDPRAVSRSIKLLLVDEAHRRVDETHALRLHRRLV